MNASHRKLVSPQRHAEIVTHRRLHEPLNRPETDRQQQRVRNKVDQEGTSSEAHSHLSPTMLIAGPFAGTFSGGSSPMGIKKPTTELCPGAIRTDFRKK